MPASSENTALTQRRRRTAIKLALAGVAASSIAFGLAAVGGAQDSGPGSDPSDAPTTVVAEDDGLAPSAIPTVTAVAPNTGPAKGGAQVVITGTGFTGATKVEFGDVGDATDYTVVSATRIVATVPDIASGGTAGAKIIKVTNADGANTSGSAYTYVAPTVTSISPNFAKKDVAKTVTIKGTGFASATKDDVFFNFSTPAKATKVWVISDTELVATTPTTGTDNGQFSVSVKRGNLESSTTVAAANSFVFTPGAPAITGLSKTDNGSSGAPAGQPVDINGSNMWGVTSVNFGTTVVSTGLTVASDGAKVTVNVPARTVAGTVDVTVTSAAGTSSTNLSTSFTYLPTVAPTITTVAPAVLSKAATGGGGTLLATGTGFTGVIKDNVTLHCIAASGDVNDNSDVTSSSVLAVGDTSLIITFAGNAGKEATCDLIVAATTDTTKKATKAAATRYV